MAKDNVAYVAGSDVTYRFRELFSGAGWIWDEVRKAWTKRGAWDNVADVRWSIEHHVSRKLRHFSLEITLMSDEVAAGEEV